MCDIFSSKDAHSVLQNKKILFVGDSNIRSFYKDLVYLIENNKLLSLHSLKQKLGAVVPQDKIIECSPLHRGRDYYEIRKYEHRNVRISFHFVTKCFTNEIKEMFLAFKKNKAYPDIVIMNSCLWDISRWGPNGVLDYKDNMVKLMKLLKSCLPEETLFLWTCVPPVSNRCSGGLLVKQVQFLEHSLRFDVMEGNMFAREVVVSHGFDVLDIHYYLRMQIHWRAEDGVHWLPHAVRHVTNLILTHICVALSISLPGNIKGESVERFKSLVIQKQRTSLSEVTNLPKVPNVISKKNKNKRNHQISNFIMDEKAVLSPLRSMIKEKTKHSKERKEECYAEDSVCNISQASDFCNESYVSDISFEAPSAQYEGRGMNFETPSHNFDIVQSPLPNFRVQKKRNLRGPIRFHVADRWSRTHRAPYSYH